MHYTFNGYWRLLPLFSTEKRLNLAQCCHVVVEYFRSMRNNLNFIQNLPSLRRWGIRFVYEIHFSRVVDKQNSELL